MLGVDDLPGDPPGKGQGVNENETNADASVDSFCLTLPLPSLYTPATPVSCRQKDALQ